MESQAIDKVHRCYGNSMKNPQISEITHGKLTEKRHTRVESLVQRSNGKPECILQAVKVNRCQQEMITHKKGKGLRTVLGTSLMGYMHGCHCSDIN